MRERRLVLEGSFCDTNLYPDGSQTYAQALEAGRQLCPHFTACNEGGLHPVTGFQCVMMFGLEVAQHVLKEGSTIESEIKEFRKADIHPRKGWVHSTDRKEFRMIPDGEEAIELVEHFAHVALDDGDPTEHRDPRLDVGGDFNSLVRHATTKDGAVDLATMGSMEGRFGFNGGRGCDVNSGPCSCGAFH